jgi:hypothetical protein
MTKFGTKTQFVVSLVLAIALAMVIGTGFKTARAQEVDHGTALAAFERIKKLKGTWQATSTKGWEERQQFSLIARGTAVVSQSESSPSTDASKADVAPDSSMLTVFHMDGDRLLLTHYCEAGNHLRLVAAVSEDAGRTLRFSFLDATNLASRASGHMHAVVIKFVDDTHFDEQWSRYENGKEQWMETIHNVLIRPAAGQR